MKEIILLLLLLSMWNGLSAQTMDTVKISYRATKFNPKQHMLMMLETIDTTDAQGRKLTMTRFYYFDKKQRRISTVREYDNPAKQERGTQVIYTYAEDHLAKVTVIPPLSECRNCASEYYFASDSLWMKKEPVYANPDPERFARQARYFQTKLPRYLPWGYFEDEKMVGGKIKKLKRWY